MAAKAATRRPIVTVALSKAKETKNTIRFENADEDAAINVLYVNKTAFSGDVPETVHVEVYLDGGIVVTEATA